MRERIRVRRVQHAERTINAPDESAIERMRSQLEQPIEIVGPRRTGNVEIEIRTVGSQ